MYPRLELLRELLSEDGSIWVTVNDNEAHYLKVIMDEVFGRKNFIANAIWQKRYSPSNDAIGLSENHDHILITAKNRSIWSSNLLPRKEGSNSSYKNPDNDPRGDWMSDNYTCNKNVKERPNLYYAVINPNTGEEIWPKKTAVWRYAQETHQQHIKDNLVWWGKNGTNSVPRFKRFQTNKGRKPDTFWTWEEVGHNQDAKREQQEFFPEAPFSTPKPEKLIQRVLQIATNENDLVLDSFLGSGTTAAVAHKMNRRYIGIEMGDHAKTHCAARLQKVVDGEQGGISKDVNWQGGGGFRFYHLGEAIFDEDGHINPDIKFPHLAAHIWFSETRTPYTGKGNSPLLGVHNGVAYYLLYNGILGDKRVNGGNVLTSKILDGLPEHPGPKVIYGETSRLGPARLLEGQITFKQTPYDIKAR